MRHHRRRTRGFAYRLTRIVAVVTLVLWGGLLLAAMFNYNKPFTNDAESRAEEEIALQIPRESDYESRSNASDTPAKVSGSPAPAKALAQAKLAENRPADALDATNKAGNSERHALNIEKSTDNGGEPDNKPREKTLSKATAARPDVDSRAAKARPGTQSAAAQADVARESDLARFETAPESVGTDTSVSASSDHVARAQFTTRISAREPTDRVETLFHSNGQSLRTLFYFTEITGLSGETVTHRWEHNGQVVATVSFDIGSDRWRVYSSKDLSQTMKGDWRVVVTDSNGEIIKTDSFAYDES